MSHALPPVPDGRTLPRFSGIRTFMRLPQASAGGRVDVAIAGIPFDTATSFRPGARFAPEAIRAASALLRPYHPAHGVDVLAELAVADYGDLPIAPGDVQRTYDLVQAALEPLVNAGAMPLVLGGDHSITLAELRALAQRHGPLALVQFDAHADTWDEYFGSPYFHGTTFRRAAEEGVVDPARSVQIGMRGSLYSPGDRALSTDLGFQVIDGDELARLSPAELASAVRSRVGGAPAFLSFDVDFVDPAFAPGTGTPEIAGPSSREAVAYVRALRGLSLVGADCVELSPPYDGAGQQTALLAAGVVWELLALRAAGSAGGGNERGRQT